MISPWLHVAFWCGALVLGLSTARIVAATRAARAARAGTMLVALRIALVALVAALYYKAFHGRVPVREEEGPDHATGRTVLLLEDRSRSMGLTCRDGRSRTELAQGIWSELVSLHRKTGDGRVDLAHATFARNVTDAGDARQLLTDATNLTGAVASCLGREVSGSVVVVSDGASTDGPVPRYLVDWMSNYGLGVYAVCAGTTAEMIDAAVTDPSCAPVDPEFISARVTATGFEPDDEGTVMLAFDDEPHAKLTVPLCAEGAPRWDVPELAPGWHTYTIVVSTARTEATDTNNVVRGTFRISRAEAVLFVTGSLRPGDFQVARVLRALWHERVCVVRADNPRLNAIVPKSILLLILSDVAPNDVPAPLRDAVLRGEVTSIHLASPALSGWCRPEGSRVPVSWCGRAKRLPATRCGTSVRKNASADACGLEKLLAPPLRLDYIYEANYHEWAEVLLDVADGPTARPLLVVDDLTSPRNVAFMTDMAWKWALHPDGGVRGAYYTLWAGLVDRLIGAYVPEDQLTVSFAPAREDSDEIVITVRSAAGRPPADLEDVELEIQHGADHASIGVEAGPNGHTLVYRRDDGPAIAWFRATARIEGKTEHSTRTPLVFDAVDREFFELRTRPDLLAQMVTQPDRFASYESRAAVLRAAMRSAAASEAVEPRVRQQRSFAGESVLAMALLFVAGLEWRTERRAHHRRAGDGGKKRGSPRRRTQSHADDPHDDDE